MKKILIILIITVTPIAGYFTGTFLFNKTEKENQLAQVVNTETSKKEEIIPKIKKETTIMFLGDMMIDRGVESSVKKNFEGDFNKLFDNIKNIKEVDILFANLEGPISNKGKMSVVNILLEWTP